MVEARAQAVAIDARAQCLESRADLVAHARAEEVALGHRSVADPRWIGAQRPKLPDARPP